MSICNEKRGVVIFGYTNKVSIIVNTGYVFMLIILGVTKSGVEADASTSNFPASSCKEITFTAEDFKDPSNRKAIEDFLIERLHGVKGGVEIRTYVTRNQDQYPTTYDISSGDATTRPLETTTKLDSVSSTSWIQNFTPTHEKSPGIPSFTSSTPTSEEAEPPDASGTDSALTTSAPTYEQTPADDICSKHRLFPTVFENAKLCGDFGEFTSNESIYYWFISYTGTFDNEGAVKLCSSKNASLATFPNQRSYNITIDQLRPEAQRFSTFRGATLNMWIGVEVNHETGRVTYPSSNTYVEWYEGYPRQNIGKKTALFVTSNKGHIGDGMWNTRHGSLLSSVLCRRETS